MKVHLNYATLERHLKSAAADRRRKELAETIAQHARDQRVTVGAIDTSDGSSTTDLPVIVSDAGNVILAHPAGEAVEAKYGTLVKAAAAVGLEVKNT